MSNGNDNSRGSTALLEAWMKAAAQYWENAEKMTPQGFPGVGYMGKARESMKSSMKGWEAAARLAAEPDAFQEFFKGINAAPEILIKTVTPALQGMFRLQQDWMERASRIGRSTEAYKFENLDQEAFKAWSDIYEKEFKQFLNIPQIGLTREYQERSNQVIDKYNVLQAKIAEFFSLLFLPFEKSAKVMQEKLGEMAEEGALPEKSKDYYRMWVKVLEGHYMNLFRSPEYVQATAEALTALSEYRTARRRMLEDVLQAFPVPTQRDMDEFYKEIYHLKRRIRELERERQD